MKSFLSFIFFLLSLSCLAQTSTARQIEPGQKTSFDNYGLLIIAILGLFILVGLGIWFKRTRNR